MLTGLKAWEKAAGLLLTFISLRAAFHAIQQIEKGPNETILLLREINKKLGPSPEETEDIDYYEIL